MRNRAERWRPDADSSPFAAPDSIVQTLFEHGWDAFAVMNLDGRIRYVSPSNRRILGYSTEDLVGKIGFELVHPDDRPQVDETVEALRREPESVVTFEHRFRAADGSWRQMATTMQSKLEHPAIRGLVIHSRDVTDQNALHTELQHAEQQLQRLQLHPHFVLNVLQSIQTQLLTDPDAAANAIADFGELLRLSYQHVDEQMTPLGHEINFVERYVDLYRHRLSRNIETTIHVPDALRSMEVPSLLLQPLVENSLRHGLQPAGGGHLQIRGRRVDGKLELAIRDDGIGLGDAPNEDGVGLSVTRRRLQQIYGDGARLDVRDAPDGGTLATITVPITAPTSDELEGQPAR